MYTIKNEDIEISVKRNGAELCSLKDKEGNQLLWQANADYWPRHAPVLFPIVGRLKNDTLIHQDTSYPMSQHGFARDKTFECIDEEGAFLSFRLKEDDNTLRQYPFPFEFLVNYALIANRLMIVYTVRNYHDQELPFSVGGHPAFNWPLLPDTNPQDYAIYFEQTEPFDIWQLEEGLIHPALRASPLQDKKIQLEKTLFDHDALIFPDLNSESVFYGISDDNSEQQGSKKRGLKISYAGFPDLGIWSKPNAPFVCIEPWVGHSSPMLFDGEFTDKPGVEVLPPYSERSFSYSIEVETI